jgi:hypothetical protein
MSLIIQSSLSVALRGLFVLMGLKTWQPIEVLVSLRPHAGLDFHPVFLIGVNVAGNLDFLVFLVRSSPSLRQRRTPQDDRCQLNAIGIHPGRILKY